MPECGPQPSARAALPGSPRSGVPTLQGPTLGAPEGLFNGGGKAEDVPLAFPQNGFSSEAASILPEMLGVDPGLFFLLKAKRKST